MPIVLKIFSSSHFVQLETKVSTFQFFSCVDEVMIFYFTVDFTENRVPYHSPHPILVIIDTTVFTLSKKEWYGPITHMFHN